MDRHYTLALDQALTWINANYEATGIIISGSIIRGNPNTNSDFDIYVIHDRLFRQRVQKLFNGVPCEIFVNSLAQVYSYFEKELATNRPVSANMIATGRLYQGTNNQAILTLIADAKRYACLSPSLTEEQLMVRKYVIANLFDDATDLYATDSLTALYILDKVVIELIEFIFSVKQLPLPRLKDRLATVLAIEPATGHLIAQYFKKRTVEQKYALAKQLVLDLTDRTGFFEWSSTPEYGLES